MRNEDDELSSTSYRQARVLNVSSAFRANMVINMHMKKNLLGLSGGQNQWWRHTKVWCAFLRIDDISASIREENERRWEDDIWKRIWRNGLYNHWLEEGRNKGRGLLELEQHILVLQIERQGLLSPSLFKFRCKWHGWWVLNVAYLKAESLWEGFILFHLC